MDLDVIRAKQDSIVRCIQRISTKKHLSDSALLDDYDAQDVVVLNLERAVQLSVDIAMHVLAETNEPVPDNMRAAFAALQRIGALSVDTAQHMAKAAGFRNIAVHAYRQIDWDIVRSIMQERLDDFTQFIRELDDYLARPAAS